MAKHILMLGIGGTGSNVVSRLASVRNKDASNKIQCIAVDTASDELARIKNIHKIDLGSTNLFKDVIINLGKEEIDNYYLSLQSKNLAYIENIQTHTGSNAWRVKANLMFEDYIKDEVKSQMFAETFKSIVDLKDKDPQYEMYVVSSIAGGTGSALLIPLTTYLKSYFKKQFKADLKVTSLLILPEIYRDSLSKELLTKAYSNAYMVLRELNAYDICEVLNNPNKDSYFQLLNKYNHTKDNPFDQIFLFDRIPGLGSITLHEHIICDIVNYMTDLEVKSILKNKNENKSYDNYSTISLSKIKYPKERIIQYLNCQRNYDILNNTYGKFVNTLLTSIRADHKTITSDSKDITVQYFATKVFELSTTYNLEKDINENIFCDEAYDSDLYKNESYNVVNDYYKNLKDKIASFFELGDYTAILDFINKLDYTSRTKKNSIKKHTRKYIEENIDKIYQNIKNVYDYSFYFLDEDNFHLNEKFTDKENMGDQLSFVSNLFYSKNECLPGPIQLSRLAYLYIKVCNDTAGFELPSKLKNHLNDTYEFNTKLLEISGIVSPVIRDDNYIDNGPKRLINLLEGHSFKDLSYQTIALDITKAFERVVQMNFLLLLKQNVEKYLISYQQIVMNYNRNLNNYLNFVDEVKESSLTDSGSIYYYHNSIEEKQELYAEVVIEERKEKQHILEENTLYAREFLKMVEDVMVHKYDTLPIMEYFKKMETAILPVINNTEVGMRVNTNTIVKLMIEDINKGGLKDVKQRMHSLIDSVFTPIRINRQNTEEKINQTKVLIISKNQADFINNCNFRTAPGSKNDKIRILMRMLEQDDASVHIQDSVLDNELYVVNCIESLKLTQIDLIDETGKGISYYSNYETACENAKCKETPMWSPNLYLGKKVIFDLPYISKTKDDIHNKNITKALIYCLTNKEIKAKHYPELNKSLYYLNFNNENVFLIVNGEEVQEKEYDKLILFFKNNEYLTNFYVSKFDKIFIKLKSFLPFTNIVDQQQAIIKRVTKEPYYKALRDNLFINDDDNQPLNLVSLAYMINQKGLILNHDFGFITLVMIIDVFKNLVTHETLLDYEKTKIILGYLLNNFFDFKNNSKEVSEFIKTNLQKLLKLFVDDEDIFALENLILKTNKK